MSRTTSAIFIAILLCGLGYALGSGWIKIEVPGVRVSLRDEEANRRPERIEETPTRDTNIVRTQQLAPLALASSVVAQGGTVATKALPTSLRFTGFADQNDKSTNILASVTSEFTQNIRSVYFNGKLSVRLDVVRSGQALSDTDYTLDVEVRKDGGAPDPKQTITKANKFEQLFNLDSPGVYRFAYTITQKDLPSNNVTLIATLDWTDALPLPLGLTITSTNPKDEPTIFHADSPGPLTLNYAFQPTSIGTTPVEYAKYYTARAKLQRQGDGDPVDVGTVSSFDIKKAGTYDLTVEVTQISKPSNTTTLTTSFTVAPTNGTPVISIVQLGNQSGGDGLQGYVGTNKSSFTLKAHTDRKADLTVFNARTRRVVSVAKQGNSDLTDKGGDVSFTIDASNESVLGDAIDLKVVDKWTLASSPTITAIFQDPPKAPEGFPDPIPTYPEVLRPRRYPDGFNESDRVTTRVAHLYYFRDARRVAQIINQGIKSYNKVSVNTRITQASESRRDADDATDARRRQEVLAVRAAQETRAAEKELAGAQSDLATAQSIKQANQSTIDSNQQQIDRNKSALTDLTKKISDLQDLMTKGSLQPQQQKSLDDLKKQQDDLTKQQTLLQEQVDSAKAASGTFDASVLQKTDAVTSAQHKVQSLREKMNASSDELLKDSQLEDRARADQFRKEVAAAEADPNSVALGDPNSDDPVKQVTLTVIGEGLIQLRGPLKGINVIRTMIDQIDAPVGQVRVNVHTIQINGEHGNRMEDVATRIQDQVDHSRFLTLQSAQMLRKAVNRVAARRADEAVQGAAADPSLMKLKYMESFFGHDFLEELRSIDSEFLRSGNKLLSLHSMDTTSLASALFLLGLCDNEARAQILEEFRNMLANDLIQAESTFLEEGGPRGKKHALHKEKFYLLAQNARFAAIQGYFNDSEMQARQTLSPVQREFIKLAQIMKSRLVTEREWNQRVKERSLLEQRFVGSYEEEVRRQNGREQEARAKFEAAQQARFRLRDDVARQFQRVNLAIQNEKQQMEVAKSSILHFETIAENIEDVDLQAYKKLVDLKDDRNQKKYQAQLLSYDTCRKLGNYKFNNYIKIIRQNQALNEDFKAIQEELIKSDEMKTKEFPISSLDQNGRLISLGHFSFQSQKGDDGMHALVLKEVAPTRGTDALKRKLRQAIYDARNVKDVLDSYVLYDRSAQAVMDSIEDPLKELERIRELDPSHWDELLKLTTLRSLTIVLDQLNTLVRFVEQHIEKASQMIADTNKALQDTSMTSAEAQKPWRKFEELVKQSYKDINGGNTSAYGDILRSVNESFAKLDTSEVSYRTALESARRSRMQLDQKKLLDGLIDEAEDKLIELLEASRAHTSNIDSYIRAISTALEDDFNTQFYFPAFREIRKASRYWDVNLSQIETTSVLTNNRGFGKVDPQATMEFDLPRRDIVIAEAMKGAKAMVQDYGALLEDPTFLALTKLNSGQPTSTFASGFGAGQGSVRNVLPGLPSVTDQMALRQSAPGGLDTGSALQSLVPDPAIYKFETGTGFEIRPIFQPDGQSVTFDFDYMYTTNVREPVRADEKHLGRVKRHFIHTPVQLLNYEMKEVSRYQVALKASRTSRGVPLFEDIPGVGILFRPLPNAESSLQQNLVLAQTTIFPTLFDLMGLRWAPAVADIDPMRMANSDFVVNARKMFIEHYVYDRASSYVDDRMGVLPNDRRADLYRDQSTIPINHPNGYQGRGMGRYSSEMQDQLNPYYGNKDDGFSPDGSPESSLNGRQLNSSPGTQSNPSAGPMRGYPTGTDGSMMRFAPAAGVPSTVPSQGTPRGTPDSVGGSGSQPPQPPALHPQQSTATPPPGTSSSNSRMIPGSAMLSNGSRVAAPAARYQRDAAVGRASGTPGQQDPAPASKSRLRLFNPFSRSER